MTPFIDHFHESLDGDFSARLDFWKRLVEDDDAFLADAYEAVVAAYDAWKLNPNEETEAECADLRDRLEKDLREKDSSETE
jgi:hypothetical protein